ncbi:MAG: isoamylase [Proteobacteria bacterium]|nr:isoamylase [Pseudomonadota bacterium]
MKINLLAIVILRLAVLPGCADNEHIGGDDESATANPLQLGAMFDCAREQVTFRVYSARATRIEVYLYAQPFGADEVAHFPAVVDPATDIWSVTVAMSDLAPHGITDHVYYGYRAWGPNFGYHPGWTKGSILGFTSDVDSQGNRFNPNKLLLDPYALEISHDPTNTANTDGTVFATGSQYRAIDSGPHAPKGIVFSPRPADLGVKPTGAFKDDIVYEVHVRGLTMNDASIPPEYRGTYRGAGMKAAALAQLGVTAVEFLPVHETLNDVNDANPTDTTGDNYWGYMTINYFAPDRRYAHDQSPGGPTSEFKEMVKAFHDVGLKVYIDVVYNHTAEEGPLYSDDVQTYKLISYRGLDNPTYYSLTADRQRNYDNTGVGGNFNTYNPVAQNLIVDSLLYWRDQMGVDGYRFDLASVLGNRCEHGCFQYDKMDPRTALNRIWRDLSPRPGHGGTGVDLIAEPWAIGDNSYQVGNFPSGWIEWNGLFRDTLRADQNLMGIESITPGQLATRLAGSSDLYGDDGRKPWNSVNFMVAHDGFTLRDLYACNHKQNDQPWPYGPSDGGEDHNRSWDQGGDAAQQRRATRNGLAFLMLGAGTPMITGGDQFLRTQYCNNNAYNLDSHKNWLDYALDSDQSTFATYAGRLIAFRRDHPALRPADFYSSADHNGNVMEQLRWFKPDGSAIDDGYFQNPHMHALAWRIDGSEFGDPAAAIYVAYNGWSGYVDFTLPWPGSGRTWYRVTDTCNWAEGPDQVAEPGSEDFIGGEWTTYSLCDRGLLVLIAR